VSDIGTRLRQARESRGLTLQQVEETLRIRRQFLAALEEERYDELPGEVYTRGFLLNYARFLGLPAEDMIEEYSGTHEVPRSLTQIPTVLDEPLLSTGRRQKWPGVFVGLMLALLVLLGGYYAYARLVLEEDPLVAFRSAPAVATLRSNGGSAAATTPQPTRTRTPAPAPTGSPAGSPGGSGLPVAPPVTPSPSATLAGSVPTPTPRHTLTPTATPTATVEQPTPAPTAEGATPPPAGSVTVLARVVETVWVSVMVDGQDVLAATLEPGEEYTWVGQESITIRIGNAAGLELTVDGEPVGPLGASGEVVDVSYTPAAAP